MTCILHGRENVMTPFPDVPSFSVRLDTVASLSLYPVVCWFLGVLMKHSALFDHRALGKRSTYSGKREECTPW